MDNDYDYLKDLEVLFNMDLINNFERVDNTIVVTMEDGSKVRVLVKQIAQFYLLQMTNLLSE